MIENNQLNGRERGSASYEKGSRQKKSYKRIGNYIELLANQGSGGSLLVIGPNYLFFVILFIITNIISVFVIIHLSHNPITLAFYYLSILILIYLDVTWIASTLINPGIALQEEENDGELCQQCFEDKREIIKTGERFHCRDCGVCIQEQVMHFRLIGGCVGKNNFYAFKFLLLGIFLWVLSLITILPQFGTNYL